MADRSYRWLLITLAVVGLGADQVSKYGVFRWLYDGGNFHDNAGNSYSVVPGWFKLIAQFDPYTPPDNGALGGLQTWSAPVMPRVNHGALFGLGQGKRATANWFFAGVSVAAALAIVIWGTRRGPAREKWLCAALGLILGGTVGNLYDRLVFGGVRDFLYFYYVEWPVFNVADCCLVAGAGLLLFQAVFVPPPAPRPAAADEATVPAGTKA
jgi:lipoprotein signal peptidase